VNINKEKWLRMKGIPQKLTKEDESVYTTLIEGYNTMRHNQRWTKVSVADILEWENYKAHVINRIATKIKENKIA
jgi:hypothetical protein